MKITNVRIRKIFDEDPMRAVVSVTFDDSLVIHDIKIIHARENYFIVMPSRKLQDGTYRDIAHPINMDFRGKLEKAILDAYTVHLAALKEEE